VFTTAEPATTNTATTATAFTSVTTTATQQTTTVKPGRKFDALSFIGGMILVGGLVALAYLVVKYLRKTGRLQAYSTLR